MYGNSPFSVAIVCEPDTVHLYSCPPPEHCSWYSVITPLGFTGGYQPNSNDVECDTTDLKSSGGVSGPGTCYYTKLYILLKIINYFTHYPLVLSQFSLQLDHLQ